MMNADQAFFDRLETYYDFRDAKPEDFSPLALQKLARDLVQMCGVVHMVSDRMNETHHCAMLATIVGEEGISVEDWQRSEYPLNEGARLLACALSKKFGFLNAA